MHSSVVVGWSHILHDHIVGGDAITGNEEKGLVVDLVEIANLASGDQRQGALQVCSRQSLSHCV